MCVGIVIDQQRVLDLPKLELQKVVKGPVRVQKTEIRQEEQAFLTTESSLQHLLFFFSFMCMNVLPLFMSVPM